MPLGSGLHVLCLLSQEAAGDFRDAPPHCQGRLMCCSQLVLGHPTVTCLCFPGVPSQSCFSQEGLHKPANPNHTCFRFLCISHGGGRSGGRERDRGRKRRLSGRHYYLAPMENHDQFIEAFSPCLRQLSATLLQPSPPQPFRFPTLAPLQAMNWMLEAVSPDARPWPLCRSSASWSF